MSEKYGWGILGTGSAAQQFATALVSLPDAVLAAVGSRRQETADAFGKRFGVAHRWASYEAVAADPNVDIVYIATPHIFHHRDALLCLEAGKHVLVEKAFTVNERQAQEVVEMARAKRLFLMEAMWTRFFPLMIRLRELLAEQVIGPVQMVRIDLSHRAAFDPHNRYYNPDLGGGALLDIGIYPISLASMILGRPQAVTGLTHLASTGVDAQSACLLGTESGAIAVLSFSQTTHPPREALVAGTEGFIQIHGRWHQPAEMTVSRGGAEERITMPFEGNGYQYEAAAAMNCIRQGQTESEIMPLDETLWIMAIMDRLRAQWGLVYPGE